MKRSLKRIIAIVSIFSLSFSFAACSRNIDDPQVDSVIELEPGENPETVEKGEVSVGDVDFSFMKDVPKSDNHRVFYEIFLGSFSD